MTLDQIFKEKPELLKEKEVSKLIEYVQDQHKRTVGIAKRFQDFHDFVLDKLMYSEVILIDGKDSKETLIEILNEINDM